jgi:membrane protease YdiL (CAAX protease family)
MENEVGGSPVAPSENQPQSPNIAQKIFFNERGLRAGWRFLIYVLIAVVIGLLTGILISHFVGRVRGTPPVWLLFLQEIIGFLVVFGAALIMTRIERRPVGVYGIPASGAFGKLFWQGWFFGLVEVSALVGLIAACGGYSFGSLAIHGTALLRWALIWAVFFVFVGFFEEFMFRGYTQFTLADGIGFWPAAILLSVGFGAIHLGNPGEGLVGAAAVVAIALVLALTLKRTGNLWFAIGLHASFDFGETFLFSVPNSGIVFDGHLSNSMLHGAKWLTGGTVGPEGSVFSFITMGVMAIVVHFCYPPKKELPETAAAVQTAVQ